MWTYHYFVVSYYSLRRVNVVFVISKGQRRIRTQRYFYQPKDIVIYNGKKYVVKGVQNKGNYIKLEKLN